MAAYGLIRILSNDGSQTLMSAIQVDSYSPIISVTSTGVTQGSKFTYSYSGNKKFLGVSTTPNATEPTYAVGGEYTLPRIESLDTFSLYIVEGEANTLTLTYDLSQLDLPEGTHSITVVAKADGYTNSAPSNAVEYVVESSLPVWNGTDLTGTTWEFDPRNFKATASYGIFNVNGHINHHFVNSDGTPSSISSYDFDQILIGYQGNYNKSYGAKANYVSYKTSGSNYVYRAITNYHQYAQITFTNGTDATKTSLISWIKQYGTLTSHTMA